MRSESIARLDHTVPTSRPKASTENLREEIAAQTQAFLEAGGQIQEVPSAIGTAPVYEFNAGPVVDRITGRVVSLPAVQVVDGETWITLKRVEKMVGLSGAVIRKRVHTGRFPEPVSRNPQWRWKEQDVLDHLADADG